MRQKACNREVQNGASPEPANMGWLFDLLNLHMRHTGGVVCANVRLRIRNADAVAAKELGGDVRNPDGLRGRLFGKWNFY